MGKITLPAYKNEPEELVQGIHQALVSEETFYKVQESLSGTRKTRKRKLLTKKAILLT